MEPHGLQELDVDLGDLIDDLSEGTLRNCAYGDHDESMMDLDSTALVGAVPAVGAIPLASASPSVDLSTQCWGAALKDDVVPGIATSLTF